MPGRILDSPCIVAAECDIIYRSTEKTTITHKTDKTELYSVERDVRAEKLKLENHILSETARHSSIARARFVCSNTLQNGNRRQHQRQRDPYRDVTAENVDSCVIGSLTMIMYPGNIYHVIQKLAPDSSPVEVSSCKAPLSSQINSADRKYMRRLCTGYMVR